MTNEEIEAAREEVQGHINWAANMGFEAPSQVETERAEKALDALCEAAKSAQPESLAGRRVRFTDKTRFGGRVGIVLHGPYWKIYRLGAWTDRFSRDDFELLEDDNV